MARPPNTADPVAVYEGSVWIPRWADKKLSPLRVEQVVSLANGTNFVVKPLDDKGQSSRTRRVSYKYLVGLYEPII